MKLKRSSTLLVALLALSSWHCSSADNPVGAGADVVDIRISNNLFVPASRTVAVGTTVRWTNEDEFATERESHTVDSGIENAGSPPIFNFLFTEKDQTAQHTFNTTGTFPYYCGTHGDTGEIIVQ